MASASLHQPVGAVVAQTSGPVRLNVMSSRDGATTVTTTVYPNPAAARSGARAAQRSGATVALGVDTRVHTLGADPYAGQQWGLNAVGAAKIPANFTASGIRVGVIDTGVDGTHPDLAANVSAGIDLVKGSGNGWADGNGHGTHVAGIVAAVTNNGLGVASLAKSVTVVPIRVLDDSGSGWTSDVAEGIIWAADHSIKIVNLSLGGAYDPVTEQAAAYAKAKGTLVIAAAGNARTKGNPESYPGAYPNVLAVASTDVNSHVSYFSTQGSYVDVAAPGESILSTLPGGRYGWMSGTSMATPAVASEAALLAGHNPTLTAAQLGARILGTATDVGPAGRDVDTGAGIISALRALCVPTCPWTPPSPTPTPTDSGTPTPAPTQAPTLVGTSVSIAAAKHAVPYGDRVTVAVTVRSAGSATTNAAVTLTSSTGTPQTARTNTTGSATFTVAVNGHQTLTASVAATATHSPAAASTRVYATPRMYVSLGANRTVTVVASPAHNQLVTVTRKTATRTAPAYTYRLATTTRRFTLPPGTYRVSLAQSPTCTGGVSTWFVLR